MKIIYLKNKFMIERDHNIHNGEFGLVFQTFEITRIRYFRLKIYIDSKLFILSYKTK